MNAILVTAPALSIVSVIEAKAQCEAQERDDLDDQFEVWIAAAQAEVEEIFGHALSSQTWRLSLDKFPSGSSPILVPRPPLIAISAATYVDSNGDSQSLTGYVLDSDSVPACIYPPSTGWPSTDSDAHPAVSITYTCGHVGGSRPIDPMMKQIMLLLTGRAFEHREEGIIGTVIATSPHVYKYLAGHSYRDWTDYSGQ